eukprot:TRINITY_DN12863_c0_g1_i1.p1 TRINITY_DN12863_c0_g1~~TRINITY_DN12863_c0_g1_i1.p1  ORF type:complete len:188 (-),score=60.56 TRINITY_DN12863_c0_g1_i1:210-773(-)
MGLTMSQGWIWMTLWPTDQGRRKERMEMAQGCSPMRLKSFSKPHIEIPEAIVTRIGDHQIRYIKTLLTASIDHLCKYLKVRLEIDMGIEQVKPEEEVKGEVKESPEKEDETETENGESGSSSKKDDETDSVKDEPKPEILQNMKIHVCQVPGQYIELTGPETLEMVVEDYWKVAKPLELHYQFDMGE